MSSSLYPGDKQTLGDKINAALRRAVDSVLPPKRARDSYNPSHHRAINSFTVDCSTAGKRTLNAVGNFLFVDPLTSGGSGKISLNTGGSIELPEFFINPGSSIKGVEFQEITIEWPRQLGQSIRVVYGRDCEIKPGNPVDGGKYRASRGVAMCGSLSSPAVASRYGRLQIFSFVAAPGTESNIVVERLDIYVASQLSFDIYRFNTALTFTDDGPSPNLFTSFNGPVNVEHKRDNNATLTSIPGGYKIKSVMASNNAPVSCVFDKSPLIITPGWGLCIECNTQGVAFDVNWQGYEESSLS